MRAVWCRLRSTTVIHLRRTAMRAHSIGVQTTRSLVLNESPPLVSHRPAWQTDRHQNPVRQLLRPCSGLASTKGTQVTRQVLPSSDQEDGVPPWQVKQDDPHEGFEKGLVVTTSVTSKHNAKEFRSLLASRKTGARPIRTFAVGTIVCMRNCAAVTRRCGASVFLLPGIPIS